MLPLPHPQISPQPPAPDMSPADDARLRKRSVSEKPSHSSPPPTSEHPASTSSQPSSGRASKLFLGLISLAISSYFAYDKLYTASRSPLQDSYALCSRRGAQIYTVDPSSPRVQCISVHESKFMAAGSIGTYPPEPPSAEDLSLDQCRSSLSSIDDVRSRWSQMSNDQLQIRHLEPGQIVVPGLSGRLKFHPLPSHVPVLTALSQIRTLMCSSTARPSKCRSRARRILQVKALSACLSLS